MMLSNDEYEILTSYIQTTQRMLELENYNLENLQFVFTELVKECDIFWPLAYGCIEAFRKLSTVLSPYAFYEAGKQSYKKDADRTRLKISYLCELEAKPSTMALRKTIFQYRDVLANVTGKKGLVQEFFEDYEKLYGPSFHLRFFDFGFYVAALLKNRNKNYNSNT